MNRLRGFLSQALHQYNRSASIFELMGNNLELVRNDTGKLRLMGNEYMVAFSLYRQAELYARLCQPDEAKQAYNHAYALLEGKEDTRLDRQFDIRNIPDICESTIRRNTTLQFLNLLLACGYSTCYVFATRGKISNYIRVAMGGFIDGVQFQFLEKCGQCHSRIADPFVFVQGDGPPLIFGHLIIQRKPKFLLSFMNFMDDNNEKSLKATVNPLQRVRRIV